MSSCTCLRSHYLQPILPSYKLRRQQLSHTYITKTALFHLSSLLTNYIVKNSLTPIFLSLQQLFSTYPPFLSITPTILSLPSRNYIINNPLLPILPLYPLHFQHIYPPSIPILSTTHSHQSSPLTNYVLNNLSPTYPPSLPITSTSLLPILSPHQLLSQQPSPVLGAGITVVNSGRNQLPVFLDTLLLLCHKAKGAFYEAQVELGVA